MPVDFLTKCGIELDEKKLPVLDENYMSKNGNYLGGDIVTKNGGSIVLALNHASKIISSIALKVDLRIFAYLGVSAFTFFVERC